MVYVVLGMHKSGTTLLAQLLHTAGIHMGNFDTSLGYDQHNRYERHGAQRANRQLLHNHLIPSLGYLLHQRQWQPRYDTAGYRRNSDSTALVRFRALQRRLHLPQQRHGIRHLVAKVGQRHADWGFKDPRTCLTYPAWREELPSHRLLVVYRSYGQILHHYQVRPFNLPRLFRILYAWTLYNRCLLDYVAQATVPTLVLSYEELMQGEQGVRQVAAFIKRPLTDQRDPALYRHRSHTVPRTVALLKPLLPANPDQLYQRLQAAAHNQPTLIPGAVAAPASTPPFVPS